MALIKCPKCEKEISDKAEVCIYCGFPLKKDSNYADMPLFFRIRLLDFRDNESEAMLLLWKINDMGFSEARALVDNNAAPIIVSGLCREDAEKVKNIFDTNDISVCIELDEESTEQRIIYFDSNNQVVRKKKKKDDKPVTSCGDSSVLRCPSCGSTDVKKGYIMRNRCNICGNKW